ncbi:hypothetical protein D3C77_260940 [compost metagenome]
MPFVVEVDLFVVLDSDLFTVLDFFGVLVKLRGPDLKPPPRLASAKSVTVKAKNSVNTITSSVIFLNIPRVNPPTLNVYLYKSIYELP